jgi:hypothetical protein
MKVGEISKETLAAMALVLVAGGMSIASPLLEAVVSGGGETLTDAELSRIMVGAIVAVLGVGIWFLRGIGKTAGWYDEKVSTPSTQTALCDKCGQQVALEGISVLTDCQGEKFVMCPACKEKIYL